MSRCLQSPETSPWAQGHLHDLCFKYEETEAQRGRAYPGPLHWAPARPPGREKQGAGHGGTLCSPPGSPRSGVWKTRRRPPRGSTGGRETSSFGPGTRMRTWREATPRRSRSRSCEPLLGGGESWWSGPGLGVPEQVKPRRGPVEGGARVGCPQGEGRRGPGLTESAGRLAGGSCGRTLLSPSWPLGALTQALAALRGPGPCLDHSDPSCAAPALSPPPELPAAGDSQRTRPTWRPAGLLASSLGPGGHSGQADCSSHAAPFLPGLFCSIPSVSALWRVEAAVTAPQTRSSASVTGAWGTGQEPSSARIAGLQWGQLQGVTLLPRRGPGAQPGQ